MKPGLSLNISQKVAMTPQLAESIRFLQLSAAELADELKSALDSNVMLEEVGTDDGAEDIRPDNHQADWADSASERAESWGQAARQTRGGSGEFSFEDRLVNDEPGVHLRIVEQIPMHFPDEQEQRIALAIVESTDDSGYLTGTVADLVASLSQVKMVRPTEVEEVLHVIQRLDPIGFAARNLAECLRVQLEELSESRAHVSDPQEREEIDLALKVVDFHLNDLGRMDLPAIAAALGRREDEVAAAVRLIRSLSPKPAADEKTAVAIVPDVTVEQVQGEWTVRLNNSTVPSLRINAEYERIVTNDASAKALRDQLQDARWLIRSVEMRNETLLRATRFIFEHQQTFLARGETALKPLTLKFVADAIGVHESTISRITTSKFVQTPHGVFPLKAFFPSQLVVADGVAASGSAVKATIQKLIAHETPEQPLRDVDLAAILARRGVRIARRTIAKYREALNIPSSKDRLERYRLDALIQRRVAKAR